LSKTATTTPKHSERITNSELRKLWNRVCDVERSQTRSSSGRERVEAQPQQNVGRISTAPAWLSESSQSTWKEDAAYSMNWDDDMQAATPGNEKRAILIRKCNSHTVWSKDN